MKTIASHYELTNNNQNKTFTVLHTHQYIFYHNSVMRSYIWAYTLTEETPTCGYYFVALCPKIP